MRVKPSIPYRATLIVLPVAALAVGAIAWSQQGETYDAEAPLQLGERGFVVTHLSYVLGPDASEFGACPNGMSSSVVDIFQQTPEGQQRPGESDEAYSERIEQGGRDLSNAPDGRNYCAHPEISPPDPFYRTMQSNRVRLDGLDLDGKFTKASDFVSPSGRTGIDNQFYRAVGCNTAYQPTGQANQFDIGMYAGEWGILIGLADVDDIRNDDHVEVGIYANADPIALSPTREALEYGTYAMDQDPRFRAKTTGRIQDGVLRTDPVDVRFHHTVNSMHLERPMRDARIEATLSPDGTLSGILAGYTPVEALYDYQFGYRNAKDGAGEPASKRLRLGSANGAARVLGHTCPGVWHALHALADGHPDPKTGKPTAISTQYRFEAANAFLVDVDSSSANDALVKGTKG